MDWDINLFRLNSTVNTSTAGQKAPLSLAGRLVIAIGFILLTGGIIVTFAAFAYGHQAARNAFDRLLVGAATQISASTTIVDQHPLVDLPVPALELLALAREDRIAYRVVAPNGVTLTGYDELELPVSQSDIYFFDSDFTGAPARFVAVRRHFAERGFSGAVITIVGHTTLAREALAWEIALNAWVVVALAGIGMVALAAFSIRSALTPLRRIGDDLLRRDPKDLTPLDVAVPRELQTIVGAINRFMNRLSRQIDGMQNLISDSAHQLRTPIAALRAQAELAAEESDPKKQSDIVQRIHSRSVGLSRLTDQMLNRALVIHRADTAFHETIDLRKVAIAATEAFDDGAIFESGRLRLDLPQAPVWIRGDALSLQEAAKNLISNALQHGQGKVSVVVGGQLEEARLSVKDEGKGMTPAEVQLFSQRFLAKNHKPGTGTGIGLSIARAVAEAHGAELEATRSSGEGFEITLRMPAMQRSGEVGAS